MSENAIRLAVNNAQEYQETWPEPAPLAAHVLQVPPFEIDVLPAALRTLVADVAHRLQCPPEFAAVGAMVALATVVGRKATIRPKRNDTWTVVPNLWGVLCGRPSAYKTPSLEQVLQPLRALEKKAYAEFEEQAAHHARQEKVFSLKRQALEQKLKEVYKKGTDATVLEEELGIDGPRGPVLRRFLTTDPTVEKLGELLRDNPRGILLQRDELAGFLRTMEREGREGDRAFYLEAWDGKNPHTVDRVSRGTIRIEACCVSLLGTIQYGVIADYIGAAVAGGSGDDGLVQRFQLLVCPDETPTWQYVDEKPDSESQKTAAEVMQFLDEKDLVLLGGDIEDGSMSRVFHFSDDAQPVFVDFITRLETKLRSGDDHPAINAHLGKYRSLMPSLALLNHLADCAATGTRGAVTKAAAESAVRFCDLLEAHARRIYGAALARGDNTAHRIAEKIRVGKIGAAFTKRDIYTKKWAGLTDPDVVEKGLKVLEEFDWIRRSTVKTEGHPKVVFRVNPHAVCATVPENEVRDVE